MELKRLILLLFVVWIITPIPEITIISALIWGNFFTFISWEIKFYLLVAGLTIGQLISYSLKNKYLKGETIEIKMGEEKGLLEKIKDWV